MSEVEMLEGEETLLDEETAAGGQICNMPPVNRLKEGNDETQHATFE